MTILLLEPIHDDAHALLAAYDQVVPASESDTVDATEVVAIVTRGRGRIARADIERYPNLRTIARCGVGFERIDTAFASERGITVIYSPGTTTVAVAEHTLLMILSGARRIHQIAAATAAGNWDSRNCFSGFEINGRTLGVVGMGAVGQRVALYGAMLGMNVLCWNRTQRSCTQYTPLDDLLAKADIVTLHVALAPGTRHMIGARELALMRPGTILINTARGALIDQQALIPALDAGRPGYFCADALDPEPPLPDEPLLHHPRVMITPHVAALTDTTYRAVCLRTVRNLVASLRGDQPETGTVYVANPTP